MREQVTQQLVEALGAKAVDVERGCVMPASRDSVVAAARVLSDAGHAMAVTSSAPAGRPADPEVALISMVQMDAVDVDLGAMVVRAEAGASVEALRAAVKRQGVEIAGLAAQATAEHVGSLVMRGQLPRRSLCGVELVTASGGRIVQGGRVLKDVSGYDLAGLVLGSLGRYAILVAVTLRLQPLGARVPLAPSRGEVTQPALAAIQTAFDPAALLRRLR